ncbi:MAG: hypothetical protein NTX69_00805 [Candidatus Bipolaricaulota bacterium]|nr:hypothetical protein [Candidatus Bipolaricaulota bacterium]
MNIDISDEGKGKVEDLREVLSTVSEMVPNLLRELRGVLYSKDAAESMADAVGTFYRKLVEAGIPREDAMEMTRGYMINLRDLVRGKGITLGDRRPEKGEAS